MSKEAIASFRTALEIEPGNAYAERNLAASLGNAGFPEDAAGSAVVRVTKREIQVRWVPSEGADHLRYGVRLLSAGDYISGVPLLESLNEADPESPVILFKS